MQLINIPFGITDWEKIGEEEHKGTKGTSFWRVQKFGDIRVRIVRYSPGYVADHWCSKGHIILCLDGEVVIETKDGQEHSLNTGMSFQVADNDIPHLTSSKTGAKIFIVD